MRNSWRTTVTFAVSGQARQGHCPFSLIRLEFCGIFTIASTAGFYVLGDQLVISDFGSWLAGLRQ